MFAVKNTRDNDRGKKKKVDGIQPENGEFAIMAIP
jgi:hypothetical protein